eukprot:CAMPEP_0113526690 /NCGR_PEP_ID=MMETSP0015_2-20120614/885_1 /TAXON_ID=2838 /ORGANISM="Odontella" /LENGTH=71 /DNA_ID=CAMNT_0000425051 /DNA_START=58 /DNA_END=269 /DNA_ORIENTATION=+ /assembly_acc=CAM_ASM_000160
MDRQFELRSEYVSTEIDPLSGRGKFLLVVYLIPSERSSGPSVHGERGEYILFVEEALHELADEIIAVVVLP